MSRHFKASIYCLVFLISRDTSAPPPSSQQNRLPRCLRMGYLSTSLRYHSPRCFGNGIHLLAPEICNEGSISGILVPGMAVQMLERSSYFW